MDLRLVFAESRNRRSEAVLPFAKSAWWQRGRQLRSSPARHQNSSQGAQGRLPSLRAQLLSPLPSRGASRRTRPDVGLSRRIPLRRQETARVLISVVARPGARGGADVVRTALSRRLQNIDQSDRGARPCSKSREPASVFAAAGPGWGEPAFMGGDGGRTPARACRSCRPTEADSSCGDFENSSIYPSRELDMAEAWRLRAKACSGPDPE